MTLVNFSGYVLRTLLGAVDEVLKFEEQGCPSNVASWSEIDRDMENNSICTTFSQLPSKNWSDYIPFSYFPTGKKSNRIFL